ncbi:unnamed protein product [Moneuplotes crassus]|uniref:Uncharacterized protein n=1 Tax=Euplotes crassus TaxID=5936 RepID=A0AAD1XTP8_EUPCR|nr:unnamed protein product [Moneuplotes crassus]
MSEEAKLLEIENEVAHQIHYDLAEEFTNKISLSGSSFVLNCDGKDEAIAQFLKLPLLSMRACGVVFNRDKHLKKKKLYEILKLLKHTKINFIEITSQNISRYTIQPFLLPRHNIFNRVIQQCSLSRLYFTEKSCMQVFQGCRNVQSLKFKYCQFCLLTKSSESLLPSNLRRLYLWYCRDSQNERFVSLNKTLHSILGYIKAQNLLSSLKHLIFMPLVPKLSLANVQAGRFGKWSNRITLA